jgi:hypothetical protein
MSEELKKELQELSKCFEDWAEDYRSRVSRAPNRSKGFEAIAAYYEKVKTELDELISKQ